MKCLLRVKRSKRDQRPLCFRVYGSMKMGKLFRKWAEMHHKDPGEFIFYLNNKQYKYLDVLPDTTVDSLPLTGEMDEHIYVVHGLRVNLHHVEDNITDYVGLRWKTTFGRLLEKILEVTEDGTTRCFLTSTGHQIPLHETPPSLGLTEGDTIYCLDPSQRHHFVLPNGDRIGVFEEAAGIPAGEAILVDDDEDDSN